LDGAAIAKTGQPGQRSKMPEQVSFPLKLGHYFGTEKGLDMARKRHSDEDILKLLREVEVKRRTKLAEETRIGSEKAATVVRETRRP
jgi:hypothetical protein